VLRRACYTRPYLAPNIPPLKFLAPLLTFASIVTFLGTITFGGPSTRPVFFFPAYWPQHFTKWPISLSVKNGSDPTWRRHQFWRVGLHRRFGTWTGLASLLRFGEPICEFSNFEWCCCFSLRSDRGRGFTDPPGWSYLLIGLNVSASCILLHLPFLRAQLPRKLEANFNFFFFPPIPLICDGRLS